MRKTFTEMFFHLSLVALSFMSMIMIAQVALGDGGLVVTPVAPAPSQGVVGFLMANHTAIVGCLSAVFVAVVDLIWALNKEAPSNGFLHWLYLAAKKEQTVSTPSNPS